MISRWQRAVLTARTSASKGVERACRIARATQEWQSDTPASQGTASAWPGSPSDCTTAFRNGQQNWAVAVLSSGAERVNFQVLGQFASPAFGNNGLGRYADVAEDTEERRAGRRCPVRPGPWLRMATRVIASGGRPDRANASPLRSSATAAISAYRPKTRCSERWHSTERTTLAQSSLTAAFGAEYRARGRGRRFSAVPRDAPR
jgi:hypothetical protein